MKDKIIKKENQKYLYWAIGLIVAFIVYKNWKKKKSAPVVNMIPAGDGGQPSLVAGGEETGTNTDKRIGNILTPIRYENTGKGATTNCYDTRGRIVDCDTWELKSTQ